VCLGERLFTPSDLWSQVHNQRRKATDDLPSSTRSLKRTFAGFPPMRFFSASGSSGMDMAAEAPTEQTPRKSVGVLFGGLSGSRSSQTAAACTSRASLGGHSGGSDIGAPSQAATAWILGEGEHAEDVSKRVHTLGDQVKRLELTIDDMRICMDGLKMEVQHEQHLRHATEQALRDEMSRALRVAIEQTALRTDLEISRSSRASASSDINGIQQRLGATAQDLARLRQEILAAVTEVEGRAQQLASQEAKQQIELLWPALQQQVKSQKVAGYPVEELSPIDVTISCSAVNNGTSVLEKDRASPRLGSFEDQAQQLLRLEESIEALRQRVDARESRAMLSFRDNLPECLARHGARGVAAS